MKTLRSVGFGLLPVLLILAGCGESREVTLYLQDLQVKGPVSEPPLHITRDPSEGQVVITPRFWGFSKRSSTGAIEGHSQVSSNGEFYVDTVTNASGGVYFRNPSGVNTHIFNGSNFSWKYPSTGGGVDLDLGLSEHWALSVGATYSDVGGQGLLGYRVGFGVRQHKGSVGFRFDAGWQWESLGYESTTLAAEGSTVVFYHDKGISTTGNIFASLTINGANPRWFLNPFLQVGFNRQTLKDYKPIYQQREAWILPPFFLIPADQLLTVVDLRGEFKSTRIQLAPGAYIEPDPGFRIVMGARVSFEAGLDELKEPVLVAPFLQIDWTL
jgi:hypothetical protein